MSLLFLGSVLAALGRPILYSSLGVTEECEWTQSRSQAFLFRHHCYLQLQHCSAYLTQKSHGPEIKSSVPRSSLSLPVLALFVMQLAVVDYIRDKTCARRPSQVPDDFHQLLLCSQVLKTNV